MHHRKQYNSLQARRLVRFRYSIETTIYFLCNMLLRGTLKACECDPIVWAETSPESSLSRSVKGERQRYKKAFAGIERSAPRDRLSAGDVAAVEVNDVAQLAPGQPAAQVIGEEAHHVGLEPHVVTRHVGRDEHVGQSP
jgi:hypothetical protein